MVSKHLCKGGCGNPASHKGWCKIKWQSGNRFGVACPIVEKKRSISISKYRIEEAKHGKNPMQNLKICKKNHSSVRNKKAAETIRNLGKLGLLPQQTENNELKERRRIRNQTALQKLWEEGKHPLQSKSKEERKRINKKIGQTLDSLASLGKHPSQLWNEEMRRRIAKKSSIRMKKLLQNNKLPPFPKGNRVKYKGHFFRSSWEKLLAEFLDQHKIKWLYEPFIVPYYDTERDMVANTIPDFYLPDYNTVIEVKGWKINTPQTQDKMDAIYKLGYKVCLLGYNQIKRIKKNDGSILDSIKDEKN